MLSLATTLHSQTPDSFNPGASDLVYALACQADGRILVGGAFTVLSIGLRNRLGRLNPDGSLDAGFCPDASNTVYCLTVQADGKILVGGAFTNLAGQARSYLGRLNANGSLDTSFNPGASANVNAMVLQPDGRILVGGGFTNLAGQPCKGLGRLNPDGSLDSAFNPGVGTEIYTLAVQPDGAIIVGGTFTKLVGQTRQYLGRLSSYGDLDTGFNPIASSFVRCVAVQPDGGILVGGDFTSFGAQTHQRLARLNADGSPDTNFTASANSSVYSLVLQADARILVAGNFTTLGTSNRNYIGRLNGDGTVDGMFNPGAGGQIRSLAMQPDGKVIAGGYFSTLGGPSRSRLGRLNNTAAATQSLTYDGSTITWLRSGTSPEVAGVTFDTSDNGTDWTSLGAGNRAGTGWQLTGVSLGSNTTVRARGLAGGGYYNGSGSFIEAGLGPPAISGQPADALAHLGGSVTFGVAASGGPLLGYQWYKDGVALAGGTNAWVALPSVQPSSSGSSYFVVVTNALGSARSAAARLWVFGADSLSTSPAGPVYAIAVQADGKILIGGSFASVSGKPRNNLARLNSNGAVDTLFNPGAGGMVSCLAVQADGKIVVGGNFTNLAGLTRTGIGRLNADGSSDTGFSPPTVYGFYSPAVQCLAVQPDGKILIGGGFSYVGGQSLQCVARLNPDGTLDTSFNSPNAYNPDPVSTLANSLALQADGTILVCGSFRALSSQNSYPIQWLNSDGSLLRRLFGLPYQYYLNSFIVSSVVQADGKIVLGGTFTALGLTPPHMYLARLNTDGSLDSSFNPWANTYVYALAVQADAKILVGGAFSQLNGQPHQNIGRLNPDGSLDTSFDLGLIGSNGYVGALALQADGRILAGGSFTNLAGYTRSNLGRLNNTGPATESLDYDGYTITWSRSGAGPEVWRTGFDSSTDGTNWTYLGDGTRVTGGWQFSGAPASPGYTFRAGGAVSSSGISTWLDAMICGSPIITNQPANRTNNLGTSALFQVAAAGAPLLTYQWLKDGANLTDLGHLTGAQTPTLMLDNVSGEDAGGYSVIVSNAFGSVTSGVALLTLNLPAPARPAILVNDGGLCFRTNQFGFNIRALPGQAIVIEASTNTVNWAPIQTNLTTTLGQIIFRDSKCGLFPRRFYRAALFQGVLPPPALLAADGAIGFRTNGFGFNLAGVAGQNVVVECSTNLVNWTAVATNTLGTGPLYFSDPASGNFPQRFYRARLQ
jgi:uncharacterized delta-60 repeat protein